MNTPRLNATLDRMAARGQLRDNMDRDVCVQGLWNFLWTRESKPCWHCGEPCNWIDIDFESSLHPGPCSRAKWDEYGLMQ